LPRSRAHWHIGREHAAYLAVKEDELLGQSFTLEPQLEAAGFCGPAGDLGPDGVEDLVAVTGKKDVEIEEGFGQVGVGAAGDVEGLGELAAGVVNDERGEDGDRPVAGRDAELGEGGGQDAGVPGAAPVRAVDGHAARVVEVALGGEEVALLDGADGGVGVVPAAAVDVAWLKLPLLDARAVVLSPSNTVLRRGRGNR
jgi:hypothetical protein